MKTARQAAYDVLLEVLGSKAYSNIALDHTMKNAGIGTQEAAFTSVLVYGVLERELTLLNIISKYLTVKKPDIEVVIILQIGIYQLLYMDGVVDHAAVNETVQLAMYARKTSAKNLINAILRRFLREGKPLFLPDPQKDRAAYIKAAYSCPEWLYSRWVGQYGADTAEALAKAALEKPPLTLRVNRLKTTVASLCEKLRGEGAEAEPHPWLSDAVIIKGSGSITALPSFKKGLFHVQDAASQLCAMALDAKPGETVLDICAAPGSKSFTIAQYMENKGKLISCDLFPHKLKLIEDTALRLGINVISAMLQNGCEYNPVLEGADRILCDVPCSGLGIIRRKPEIKRKTENEIAELPQIQLSILNNAVKYLKPGGTLVYSTCTLNKKENEEIISEFIEQNNSMCVLQSETFLGKIKGIELLGSSEAGITLFPHIHGTDGFFFCVMKKSNPGDF